MYIYDAKPKALSRTNATLTDGLTNQSLELFEIIQANTPAVHWNFCLGTRATLNKLKHISLPCDQPA